MREVRPRAGPGTRRLHGRRKIHVGRAPRLRKGWKRDEQAAFEPRFACYKAADLLRMMCSEIRFPFFGAMR
jgi:hypothetical protein